MRVYYDRDADLNLIKSRTVAILGYGSQGHAHANNLRESGVENVIVGLREGSGSRPKAEGAGFTVMTPDAAARTADVVMMLTPDEGHSALYSGDLAGNMKEGAALAVAHGLSIHFNLIEPRSDLDVFMVRPRAPAISCAPNMCAAPACRACSPSTGTPQATARNSAFPMPAGSARAGRASSRRP